MAASPPSSSASSRVRELMADFPALVKLLYRLLKDWRVSKLDKAILGALVLYVINPLDLMPDAIPLLGQVDDAYLLALGLVRLVNRSDEQVIREHWEGRGEIGDLLEAIIKWGACFVPPSVRTLLLGKLDRLERKAAEKE